MTHLIYKDALVAELKKRIRDYWSDSENTMGIYPYALEEVIKYTDTLEVKEVDLEKELQELNKEIIDDNGFFDPLDIAKHFFELGMQVNNPITAADRGTAEEIIINLKRVEQDYRINLTKEIEWVRNKAQKGE